MRSIRDELLSFVESLDEIGPKWHPPEGGWIIHENLAHLTDAERAHRRYVEAVLSAPRHRSLTSLQQAGRRARVQWTIQLPLGETCWEMYQVLYDYLPSQHGTSIGLIRKSTDPHV